MSALRKQNGQAFLQSLRVVPLYAHFRHDKFVIASVDGIRANGKKLWINGADIQIGSRPEFLLATVDQYALKRQGLGLALYAPKLADHFDAETRAAWNLHVDECRVACGKVWRGGKRKYGGKPRTFSYI